MTGTTRIGTWLLLLALMSATGGSATDVVLCIAADGHCELERPLQDCCTQGPRPAPREGLAALGSDSSSCGACTDVAVALRAFRRGDPLDPANDDPRTVAADADSAAQDSTASRPGCAHDPPPLRSLAPLRAVVLRL